MKCNVNINSGSTIYRAFDNTYCSNQCLKKVCQDKNIYDLKYITSAKWNYSENDHLITIPTSQSITIPTSQSITIPTSQSINNTQSKYIYSPNIYNHNNRYSYIYKISSLNYIYILISSIGVFGLKTIIDAKYQFPQII
jgi:hypothetical protein